MTAITLPDGITVVPEGCFAYCSSLVDVTIPESVTTIEAAAFARCTALPAITLPEGVLTIKGGREYYDGAFYLCENLSTVHLPSTLLSMGDYAFLGCSNLTEITIPEGVATIEDQAFKDCTKLRTVNLSEGVCSINSSAFEGCEALRHIRFPESLVSVGNDAFYQCDNLKGIYLQDEICAVDLSAYTLPKTTVIYGHLDSPAQAYAEQFDRMFVDIDTVQYIYNGDVNTDGERGVLDVVAVQKWLVGEESRLSDWEAADLNQDGKLNAIDLALLKALLRQ